MHNSDISYEAEYVLIVNNNILATRMAILPMYGDKVDGLGKAT